MSAAEANKSMTRFCLCCVGVGICQSFGGICKWGVPVEKRHELHCDALNCKGSCNCVVSSSGSGEHR